MNEDVGRFISQLIIPEIGIEGQQKFSRTSVLTVGAGGLGCPALLYLSALGIGKIGIADHDVIEMKNLHRQILFTEQDLGQLKVEVARKRIQGLNSNLVVNSYPERFTGENAVGICSNYDFVLDCCDNMETRLVIDEVSFKLQKPFIYGGVSRFEGQVGVFNFKNGPRFKEIFPPEAFDAELSCADSGIVGYVAGLIACLQVNELIKMILSKGEVLSGEILSINTLSLNFRRFQYKSNIQF